LRTAAIRRFSTGATSQPRAAAIDAVASVDALSATMTWTSCLVLARAASTLSSRRGSRRASL